MIDRYVAPVLLFLCTALTIETMSHHKQLSPTKRARAVALRKAGLSFQQIAEELGCHKSSASRTWHRYHRKEIFYAKTPGRGRPKALDAYEHCKACRLIRSGQFDTATAVQHDHFMEVSLRTMMRTLGEEGLHGHHKQKVPLLCPVHHVRRLNFAKTCQEWNAWDWRAVIFSDESKFQLYGSDGLQWCQRGPGEAFDSQNVQQMLKHGGGRIMVSLQMGLAGWFGLMATWMLSNTVIYWREAFLEPLMIMILIDVPFILNRTTIWSTNPSVQKTGLTQTTSMYSIGLQIPQTSTL